MSTPSIPFSSLVARMDGLVQETFSEKQLTVLPLGLPPVTANATVKNPTLEEDYVPGANPGPAMLVLFIRLSDFPGVARGVVGQFGGLDYDIVDMAADREGGATLKMRQRSIPQQVGP